MGFLRTIQSLSNFAYECNETKKQLRKLKTFKMTTNELVEYIERVLSSLKADYNEVSRNTQALLTDANLTPRQSIDVQWSLVHLRNQFEMLEQQMNNHIKELHASTKIQDGVCGNHLPTEVCTRTE